MSSLSNEAAKCVAKVRRNSPYLTIMAIMGGLTLVAIIMALQGCSFAVEGFIDYDDSMVELLEGEY